jgi:uncharacterized membrane protein YwaF
MGTPKKIFFSYSNQAEDLELYKKINKHFAYAGIGLLGIIDRNELFKLTADKTAIAEILKSSDIAIPLLSIDYINDAECLQQLETATQNQIRIIPVLLRDFDWEAFTKITQYQQHMLPGDHTPVENHINAGSNDDTVFKEIAKNVKAIILPEIGKLEVQKTSHTFYYIIATIVFITGIVASVTVYHITNGFEQAQRILFTALSLLMFASIGLIALKNVLFPNKLNIK